MNFYEFAHSIIKEDVVFGSFITKLFYSMRMHNSEGEFDFFYRDFNDSWLCLVFSNLCSRGFYLDELKDVYIRSMSLKDLFNFDIFLDYKKILSNFNEHKDNTAVDCGFQKLELPFDFWLDALSAPDSQRLLEHLLFSSQKLPQVTCEAIIFLSLFGLVSFDASDIAASVDSLSLEFSNAIIDKINSGHKANETLFKLLSQKVTSLSSLLPVPKTWIQEVIDDLRSAEPVVLAHGLFLLRKETDTAKRKLLIENINEVTDLCSNALFNDDTYVFMNAVKLFQELSNASEIDSFACRLLIKFAGCKDLSAEFPRVVEVFSAWIERRAVSSSLLQKFIDVCKPMIKSEDDECRISALNALNIVFTAYPSVIIHDYKVIFAQLQLQSFEAVTANLETQGKVNEIIDLSHVTL